MTQIIFLFTCAEQLQELQE